MGVIKRGILGGFSGRVGNVVGSSWKGIAVIKSLPLSVANPKTTAQVAQRADFKATATFAAALLSVVVKPMWDRFAVKMSGYNAFLQENVEKIKLNQDALFETFNFAKGKMRAVIDSEALWNEAIKTVEFSWSGALDGKYESSDDIIVCVCWANADPENTVQSVQKLRSDLLVDIMMQPGADLSKKVGACILATRTDGTIVADSACLPYVAAPPPPPLRVASSKK